MKEKHYTVHVIYRATGAEFYHKEISGQNLMDALKKSHLDNDNVIIRGAYRVR